jgi:hypothetical protein
MTGESLADRIKDLLVTAECSNDMESGWVARGLGHAEKSLLA